MLQAVMPYEPVHHRYTLARFAGYRAPAGGSTAWGSRVSDWTARMGPKL